MKTISKDAGQQLTITNQELAIVSPIPKIGIGLGSNKKTYRKLFFPMQGDYKQSFILAFSVLAVIVLSVVFFMFTAPVINAF